jgi:hypothetical protein
MEHATCHSSDALNFKEAASFLENLCTPGFNVCTCVCAHMCMFNLHITVLPACKVLML